MGTDSRTWLSHLCHPAKIAAPRGKFTPAARVLVANTTSSLFSERYRSTTPRSSSVKSALWLATRRSNILASIVFADVSGKVSNSRDNCPCFPLWNVETKASARSYVSRFVMQNTMIGSGGLSCLSKYVRADIVSALTPAGTRLSDSKTSGFAVLTDNI
ncbi:hypothetical protein D3C76_915660 [compost metagenome]